jgi:hypothetical protein
VMLPPEAYERLIRESVPRKIAGEPKRELSSIMQDAIDTYFTGSPDKNSDCLSCPA